MLLEAVLALAVLSVAGSAAAWLATDSMRLVSRAHTRERVVRDAEQLLSAVSLWSRADLDRRLGQTSQGPFRLRINRGSSRLYHVAVIDAEDGHLLLVTSLFRADPEVP